MGAFSDSKPLREQVFRGGKCHFLCQHVVLHKRERTGNAVLTFGGRWRSEGVISHGGVSGDERRFDAVELVQVRHLQRTSAGCHVKTQIQSKTFHPSLSLIHTGCVMRDNTRPHSHRTRNAMHNAMQANGTCCHQWECSH